MEEGDKNKWNAMGIGKGQWYREAGKRSVTRTRGRAVLVGEEGGNKINGKDNSKGREWRRQDQRQG